MQADPGVTYYPEGKTVMCAPGDDGYPARVVGEMPTEQGASIRARVLQRVAEMGGAEMAREVESTLQV